MADQSGGCCRCCCSFIFTLGLTALFMWLSLRADKPTCSILNFYIPELNTSLKSPTKDLLIFELKLDNGNKDKGIYYDALNLTFYDSPNKSHLMGDYIFPGFYQGHKKKAKKPFNVTINGTLASGAVFSNKTAVFRVDLATAVRFKIMVWKTKRHKLAVGGDVIVNDQGTVVLGKKGMKLKSGAPKHGYYRAQVGVLVTLLLLILLN